MTLAANLPPVSLTPVATLPPVSLIQAAFLQTTTLAKLVAKFAAGIVDTGGGKLIHDKNQK
jgi:hypothetical protein